MENKKAIFVTGSSTGFGRSTAELLASHGHTVLATMRDPTGRNAEAADTLMAAARKGNWNLRVIDMDVTDDLSVDRAMAEVADQAGHMDVLINNAGVQMDYGALEAFTVEQIERMFAVNVFGALRVTRQALPYLRGRPDALIVWISSGLGRAVVPAMGAYSASKFAVEAIAEAYRFELANQSIDTAVIQPGAYPTNLSASEIKPGDTDRLVHYEALMDGANRLKAIFRKGCEHKDPGDIAVEIAHLIDMAPGTRPIRTRVGGGELPINRINEVSEDVQQILLKALGLDTVTTRPRSPARPSEV